VLAQRRPKPPHRVVDATLDSVISTAKSIVDRLGATATTLLLEKILKGAGEAIATALDLPPEVIEKAIEELPKAGR